LLNEATGETVYIPPSGEAQILDLISNLEKYMNENSDGIVPLIKLAVIHYQFESIHPFYDGNGRTGRLINILYLVLMRLLDSPILSLSSYIIKNKSAEIKEKLPKLYTKELKDLLFYEFYTKIQYIEEGLSVSRRTAVTYLQTLEREGFLYQKRLARKEFIKTKGYTTL